ncbi:Spermatogenesisassociated protein 5like [Caligus rogercresseyi]|uniref:Spermatogenesisassociated protein 5like n=1 Tax=Caligus rogercresseyi TaxID=217165 RepID=A0A7T8KHU6_CALRO|nr:Spermatogenesisassociated protein 5like [Caligus rogercresseyi]
MPPKSTPKRKAKAEEWTRDPESRILRHPSHGLSEKDGVLSVPGSDIKRLRLPPGPPFLLLSPALMKALQWRFGSKLFFFNKIEAITSIKLFAEPLTLARKLFFKEHPGRSDGAFISALKASLEATELPLLAIQEENHYKDELAHELQSLHLSSTPKSSSKPQAKFYSFAWNETEIFFVDEGLSGKKSSPPLQDLIGGLETPIQNLNKSILANNAYLRGILLFGPQGTGESLGYQTISIVASDLFSKFYGETENKLSELFKRACSHDGRKGTILFIDDFDCLCPKRSDSGKSDQEKRVLFGLVHMLDKYRNTSNLVVLGATSRIDAIDPVLRRPGRFDYEIEIGVPNPLERQSIFNCLFRLRNISVKDEDVVTIANKTHGYVGADLEALVSEAHCLLEEEDPEHQGDLQLSHLMTSLKKVRPSAMREVSIQIPDVTWDDIGGLEELKLKLKQAVEWPLKRPEVFTRFGIKPPKGILMYGPPGCSKTMIAKALANESGLNFMAVKGPELLSKWVGESERAVRELFRKARSVSPSIIFFDEIDSLCSSRGGGTDSKVSDRVLAQLLTEMDGVEVLNSVTVVAATNRPDMIDKALMRPGRLDRVVFVSLPDTDTRHKIFHIHSQRIPTQENMDWDSLAQLTQGYSGAEISAVCNEAALKALERDMEAKIVSQEDFLSALRIVTPRIDSNLMKIYSDFQAIHMRLIQDEFQSLQKEPPVGAIVVAHALKKSYSYDGGKTAMNIGSDIIINNSVSIARPFHKTEIDHWLAFTLGPLTVNFQDAVEYLNKVLEPNTFLVGDKVTIADYVVFGFLYMSGYWRAPTHIKRWFDHMGSRAEVGEALKTVPADAIPSKKFFKDASEAIVHSKTAAAASNAKSQPKAVKASSSEKKEDVGKFVDLPGAEMDKASGYLHIGHAKACLLNQHYRDHFKGKLVLRFDDTNPAKEKEEFENVILEDLKLLKVKYDHFSHTSDHFETMLGYCEKMIKEGMPM